MDDESLGSKIKVQIINTGNKPDVKLEVWNSASPGYEAELTIKPKTPEQAELLMSNDVKGSLDANSGDVVRKASSSEKLQGLLASLNRNNALEQNVVSSLLFVSEEATKAGEKFGNGKGNIASLLKEKWGAGRKGESVADHVREYWAYLFRHLVKQEIETSGLYA